MTIDKWAENGQTTILTNTYKEPVPAICQNSLKHKLFQFK